jgi:hypothetical protein
VSGATCGASAASVALAGQGTNGVVGVQPGSIDFGLTACGARAADRTVTISNTGNGAVTFNAALAAGTRYVVTPASGTIAAGASATLTVSPNAIPTVSLTTPDLYADTLTVTTSAFGDTPHTIALHQTARGARIVASRSTIAFGDVPVSSAQSAALTLENQGNAPATLTLGASGDDFAVTPTAATLVSPGASLAASASFSPTAAVARTGSVSIGAGASDVLCDALPPAVALSGTGTSGAVALSTSSLDFGQVDCAARAQAQSVTITNTGNGSFSFNAALSRGAQSPFSISPASATLAPGASRVVTVTPAAIPQTASTSTDAFGDTLTISTDVVGDQPHAIALHQTARGAVLRLSTNTLAFGDVPLGTSSTSAFSIFNDGNAPARVSLVYGGADFTTSPAGPYPVAAAGQSNVTGRFAPSNTNAQSVPVSLQVGAGDAICSPPPSMTFTGRGTNGSVGLSPSALDFGAVACGAQGAAQVITVSNGGNAPFTFTAGIVGTPVRPYNVGTPQGTSVAAGASVTIVVTPPQVPAVSSVQQGLYDGVLRVTTSVFGDTPHDVPLRLTARGAILTTSTSSIAFGDVPVGQTATSTLTITNAGNAPAAVSYGVLDAATGGVSKDFFVSPQGQSVAGGGNLPLTASFAASYGAHTGTASMSVPSGTVLCAALPSAVTLAGTGVRGVATVSATGLAFGQVCSSLAPQDNKGLVRNVTLSNTGNLAFTWNASAIGGRFAVAPASGTIAAGAQVAISVSPHDVPNPAGAYGDTLRITTDIPNDAAHDVALSATATGAVYTFNPTSIVFPNGTGDARLPFTIRNDGNAGTAGQGTGLSMAAGSSSSLVVSPAQIVSLAPGAQAQSVAIFWRANAPAGTHTGSIVLTPLSSEAICARRPTLPVSGTK